MRKGLKRICILQAALGVGTLVPSFAQGATWTWVGSGGSVSAPLTGSWNATANWSSGTTPADASATVLIFGGTGSTPYTSTNNFSSNSQNLGTIRLDSSASVSHTIGGNQPQDSGARTIEQLNSGAFTISVPLKQNDNSLTLTGDGTGVVTISGLISGNTGSNGLTLLTKSGTSTFVITNGSNTNWDAVSISGGILRFGSAAALASGSDATTISSGAILGLDGDFSVNSDVNPSSTGIIALNANNTSLSGSGSSSAFIGSLGDFTLTRTTANFAAGASSTYRLGGGGGKLTLSGTDNVTGANNVIIGSTQTNGSGTVVYSSNVNYSGTTSVISGSRLLVNATSSGTGAVTVNGGATLGGTGTVSGNTTVSGSGGGGTLAPGASIGKLTFAADITLQTGSTIEIELGAPTTPGTTYDQVEVRNLNSDFTTGGATLKLIALPGVAPGTYTIVNAANSGNIITAALLKNLNGTLMDDNVTTYSQGGLSFKVDYSSSSVQLIVSAVPEPGSVGLLLLAAPGLLRRRRR